MFFLPFALISQSMKRLLGSERVLVICRLKLLLNGMHVPALTCSRTKESFISPFGCPRMNVVFRAMYFLQHAYEKLFLSQPIKDFFPLKKLILH